MAKRNRYFIETGKRPDDPNIIWVNIFDSVHSEEQSIIYTDYVTRKEMAAIRRLVRLANKAVKESKDAK